MSDRKTEGVKKVVLGAGAVGLGVASALGYGITSFVTGNHHRTSAGTRAGYNLVKWGNKTFEDGCRELKE